MPKNRSKNRALARTDDLGRVWDGCTCGEWLMTRTKAPLEFWSDWERVERICDVHWEERSC